MNPQDLLHRELAAARGRIDTLHHAGLTGAEGSDSAMQELLGETYTLLEELRTGEEEIRQQNEQLLESQTRLAAEHERYRELFESAPDAYLVTDRAGMIRDANRAAGELLGRAHRALAGKPLVVWTAPESRQALHRELARIPPGGRRDDWEFEVLSRDGEPVPVVATVRDTCDGELRWLLRDVRERRRAERTARRLAEESAAREAIQASEERYRFLAENATDLVVRAAPDHTITYVSPSCTTLLGYTAEEMVGSSALSFSHPDDRERSREVVAAAPGVQTVEVRLRTRQGSYVWMESTVRALQDPATGEVREIIASTRNISERKRHEAAQRLLAEAGAALAGSLDYETTLRTVADMAVPALADWCAVDIPEDGEIRRVALAHADPTRLDVARALTRRYPLDPDAHAGIPRVLRTGEPEWVADVNEALRRGGPDADHLRAFSRFGLRSCLVVPMVARGHVLGAITLLRGDAPPYDETDLAVAAELGRRAGIAADNARLYREAHLATHVREEMVAVVSHDLRNPLNAIQLATDVILNFPEEGGLGERERKHVEVIARAAEQMQTLTSDLLEIAALEGGRRRMDLAPRAPEDLARRACETFAGVVARNGAELICAVPPGLPPVLADRERVLQVFGNLLGNAVRLTPAGGTITVRAEPVGVMMRFSVTDTGPGIAAEELPHLWDRAWQARRKRRQGTGLGLAIARAVVTEHGGQIWAQSAAGEGSSFFFTLPTLPEVPEP